MHLADEDIESWIGQRDASAPRTERRGLIEGHLLGARRKHQARKGMDRVGLVANRDPDIGARLNDRQGFGAGRHTPGAHALEPGTDIVGRDEVHDAGGLGDDAEPAVPWFRADHGDQHDRQDSPRGHPEMRTVETLHDCCLQ